MLLSSSTARANDVFWASSVGGNFGIGGNWQGGVVPGGADTARFGLSGGSLFKKIYTVSFTTNPTNSVMVVQDDLVTFDLNGHIYTTTSAIYPLIIGTITGRSGSLTVTDGTFITPYQAELVVGQGGAGNLTVSTGGLLIGTSVLKVGNATDGTMMINNNGDVIADDVFLGYFASVAGEATVTDAGSSLLAADLTVGNDGTGTLNVNAGARVDSATGWIGYAAGSMGTVNVDGVNSRWVDAGTLTVGRDGMGILNITAGGEVQSAGGRVGNEINVGLVHVNGVDSRWNNSSSLLLGGTHGYGSMDIAAGGHVANTLAEVGNGSGTEGSVTIDGAGSSWTNTTLSVGMYQGFGYVTITDGGSVLSTGATLAEGLDSLGEVFVIGNGSLWTNNGDLTVGNDAIGKLHVLSGGHITNLLDAYVGRDAYSQSTVTVDGANSQWTNGGDLHVGEYDAVGTLNITTGGQVQDTDAYLGGYNSTGTVNVDGADSQWINTGNLHLGVDSTAYLNITNGGVATNVRGSAGENPGSSGTITVDGPGSQWINTDSLLIGGRGSATLNITGGAVVQDTWGTIGGSTSSIGVVTVSGAGSAWLNSSRLYVGEVGNGTLNIQAGGHVVANELAEIAAYSGFDNRLVVTGAGSRLDINGRLAISVDIDFAVQGGPGTLQIQSGAAVDVSQDTVLGNNAIVFLEGGEFSTTEISFRGAGGQFIWSGGTLHVGAFDGFLAQGGGTMAPGASVGTTTVNSSYAIYAGSYEAQFGGVGASADLVTATDNIFIGLTGTSLDLRPLGAMPAGTYTLMQSTGGVISGAFQNVTDLGVYDDLVGVQYTANTVTLTLDRDLLAGDLNFDGFVGLADLDIVLGHWNQNVVTGIWGQGDPSGDGFVGLDDLDVVLTNWNNGTPPVSHTDIPEPGALVVWEMTGVLVACRRHTAC